MLGLVARRALPLRGMLALEGSGIMTQLVHVRGAKKGRGKKGKGALPRRRRRPRVRADAPRPDSDGDGAAVESMDDVVDLGSIAERMDRSVELLKRDLAGLRVGRADPKMFDHLHARSAHAGGAGAPSDARSPCRSRHTAQDSRSVPWRR